MEGDAGVAGEAALDMKSLAAILVLLTLAGCSTNSRTSWFKPEPDGLTVRSVHGEVQYSKGGSWDRLRVNMVFTNGARIRTGHDSEVYLSVGRSATVKLSVDSELGLTAMMVQRHLSADAIRAELELRQGTILGSVKKLPPESSFQIRGGGLTVEVRGGDVRMSAEGRVEAVVGEVKVQAGGKTYQLRPGEYFDSKKNEVGKLPSPIIIETFPATNIFRVQPGSSSLSPFERGLENARHGWNGPAAGH